MNTLNSAELQQVNGGFLKAFVDDFSEAAATIEGAAFFGGVVEGAEIGSAGGPIGLIGGALVGAAVGAYLDS